MENTTPFAAEPLFLVDDQGNDQVVFLVQATYEIVGRDSLRPAEEMVPVNLGGEWRGLPGLSSLRAEPQIAPAKPGTDVVLLGHAYPAKAGDLWVDVTLRAGPLQKRVRVFGDRAWMDSSGTLAYAPRPFEKIPLCYERAYGGWDRSHADTAKHRCDKRNPVGMGYRHSAEVKGLRLPNLEDPDNLITSVSDRPAPAGFGFLGADWEPRVKLAGTYGAEWMAQRMPLLPKDFDPRFYNAASADLIAPKHLRGDEQVTLVNASPRGRLDFRLPGLPCPPAWVETRSMQSLDLPTFLDTVLIDTDAHQVRLLWRGHVGLKSGLSDIGSLGVGKRPPPASGLMMVTVTKDGESEQEEA